MGKLFINSNQLELPPNFKFARTKQANDLGKGLSNRQTNYTQSIKLPKTKANAVALDFLGAMGNQSNVPYTISNIRYVNDSGEDEIFNGTGIVKSSNKHYNISIYDGFISFYKAIENKVLTDVGISEVNHLKNVQTVIDTWQNDLNYRYNIADYNGNMLDVNNKINIDYLVPSIKFSFLWQKVHEFAGFEYNGSIFGSDIFNNLWITYPKSNNEGGQQVDLLISNNQFRSPIVSIDLDGRADNIVYHDLLMYQSSIDESFSNSNIATSSSWHDARIESKSYLNNRSVVLKNNGTYKVRTQGVITKLSSAYGFSNDITEVPIKVVLGARADDIIEIGTAVVGELFDFTVNIPVAAGMKISINADTGSGRSVLGRDIVIVGDITTDISVVTGSVIDFEEAFIDFSVKKFINEGLFMFGLTPFKDKYSNSINYLTADEVINNKEVVDWSADKGKFVGVTNETYILKGYAQRNNFKYKYNDPNFNHNDSYFTIPNKTLKDETTIIKSSFFSPDDTKSEINGIEYNVFPIWKKEPKEDGTIKYKELSNRFYIMGSDRVEESIEIVSERANQSGTSDAYYRENFNSLSFKDLLFDYYNQIKKVLQRANVITANVYLTDADVSDVRFERPRFIKELGAYYLINKISNYVKKGISKVELTKVERSVVPYIDGEKRIIITSSLIPSLTNEDWEVKTEITFLEYIPNAFIQIKMRPFADFQNSFDDSVQLNGTGKATHSFKFKPPFGGSFAGRFNVEVKDLSYGTTSNLSSVTIPNSFSDLQFIRFHVNTRAESEPENNIVYRKIKYEFFNMTIDSNDVKIQVDSQPVQTADASLPTGQRETFIAFNDGFKEYTITMMGDGYSETKTIYIN